MSTARKILVIDDDEDLRESLTDQIALHEEFETASASTASEGIAKAKSETVDLILLDVGLPDMDGREACKILRKNGFKGPVVMLTAQDSDSDTILGLESGANDYVTKPFSIEELLARIRAALRAKLQGVAAAAEFVVGELVVDVPRHKVAVAGEEVKLTRKEFDLLRMLAQNAGRIVTHRQILREVWGPAHEDDVHYLRIYIGHLRQKLGDDSANPKYIESEPGVGYRLILDAA